MCFGKQFRLFFHSADDADFTTGPPDIPGACLTTIYVSVPSLGGPGITTTQVNPSCVSATGSITANGTGGTLPYTYSINGGAYTGTNVFNNLIPGTYAVSVMDGTGCTTGVNITLTGASVPVGTLAIQSASCNTANGSITVSVSGGTAPYEYSINGTSFQVSNVFSNLAPGAYTVYVKDANNCYSTATATITNTTLPRVTGSQTRKQIACLKIDAVDTISIGKGSTSTGNSDRSIVHIAGRLCGRCISHRCITGAHGNGYYIGIR